ncbi:hypothetical protein J2Z40_000846 [Cytobacillus eiseniae]|uniref:Uncharacterized protein n=1 Tax=Cytobacillus eiseniae TaxID=762947 RepID=A0ABS4RC50_9BACI|nr:hypothetical protein [Cytobacillus eiseniae]MBP2240293.1 hypothetical protein [Cytobacillus eiseniae]
MYLVPLLYFLSMLAGFALISVPTSAVITAGVASFLDIVGGIAVIVFAIALLYLGFKALFRK